MLNVANVREWLVSCGGVELNYRTRPTLYFPGLPFWDPRFMIVPLAFE